MTDWHGYILFEKTANLNQSNFDLLCTDFVALPPDNPLTPAHIMHTRIRLDSEAWLFEMKFDTTQIDVDAFKQYMADLFSVDVANVEDEIIWTGSYSGVTGYESRTWGFNYPVGGDRRLEVTRFGRGDPRPISRVEVNAFLAANAAAWGES